MVWRPVSRSHRIEWRNLRHEQTHRSSPNLAVWQHRSGHESYKRSANRGANYRPRALHRRTGDRFVFGRGALHKHGRPGIAKVRLELLSVPAPLTGDFTVQIGAYRDRATADRVRAKFVGRYPVFVQEVNTPKGHFFRVRVGRVASQQDAQKLAAQLRSEGSAQTFIVRLDMDGNGTP